MISVEIELSISLVADVSLHRAYKTICLDEEIKRRFVHSVMQFWTFIVMWWGFAGAKRHSHRLSAEERFECVSCVKSGGKERWWFIINTKKH